MNISIFNCQKGKDGRWVLCIYTFNRAFKNHCALQSPSLIKGLGLSVTLQLINVKRKLAVTLNLL